MYSRFGKFYSEKQLDFNRFVKEDVTLNEANTETAIHPETLEEVKISDTQLVMYYPEKINYRSKISEKAFCPLRINENDLEYLQSKSVKEE